jgi:hypothetical protein
MSKRYPGNFITGNPVALSQTSNNGIWDLTDNYTATGNSTWQEPSGIYQIGRSLRFRRASSTFLSRTPVVAGNRRTWTWSGWVKRSSIGTDQSLFGWDAQAVNSGFSGYFWFYSDNTLELGEGGSRYRITEPVYRDPSGWYHIVLLLDTTAPTEIDRCKIFVNGVLQRYSSTASLTLNSSLQCNNTYPHSVGADIPNSGARNIFDGYMTEVNFVDGQALDPSYFGYTDSITNIWMPKRYTGAYGTNGFYLPFRDNDYLGMISKDYSGTNEISHSADFSQVSFASAGVLTDQTAAPDGSISADYIYPTAGSGVHYTYSTGKPFVAGPYTASWYVKYVNHRWISAQIYDGTTQYEGSFDLLNGVTGAVASGATSTMQAVGNGWYRISVTAVMGTGIGYHNVIFINNADVVPYSNWSASGNERVAVWGAQHNRGRTADAYIATNGSAKFSFTPNNFSLTAGVTYDSMVDSPTNVFTTATDVGGVVPGNYCTMNPLARDSNLTISNGNLRVATHGSTTNRNIFGTMAIPPSSICYFEVNVITGSSSGNYFNVGVAPSTLGLNTVTGTSSNTGFSIESDQSNQAIARVSNNSTSYGGGTWYTAGDVVQVAIDRVNNRIWFGKNNTWFGSGNPSTGANPASSSVPSSGDLIPIIGGYQSGPVLEANFGQRPFAYTPPTGFKSLNTTNMQALGAPAVGAAGLQPNKWMDATLWGGVGTAPHNIENRGFKPDLVWVKTRNATNWNYLTDSARGTPGKLYTNSTNGEDTSPIYGEITSFNNNGFTVDAGTGDPGGTISDVNQLGVSYVAWQWRQSSAAGFTMVTYTGDGIDNRNITHNLGVAPSMCIIHTRNDPSARSWPVWTSALTTQSSGSVFTSSNFNVGSKSGGVLSLNLTNTAGGYGMDGQTNANGSTYVAYLWAEVPGFSKFGTYVGNGSSDGPFVNTGFRPKFVLTKDYSGGSGNNWGIFDTSRNPANGTSSNLLRPNLNDAEFNNGDVRIDFLSNGFKLRAPNNLPNESGVSYFYAAFAESPFALNNRAR